MILLNPGPANTTRTVKNSQLYDYCPRTEEFGNILLNVSSKLVKVVSDDTEKYCSVLFGSSGTGAIEAVISSVIRDNENMLVISNGAYGKRAYEIAKRHNIDVDLYDFEYEEIDFGKITNLMSTGEFLEGNWMAKSYSFIFIVHSETTTGILNNINFCGELCKIYNSKMIVDAMSSYGAHNIDMRKDNVSYLISSANKNVQGLPGTAFVICDKEHLLSLTNESKSYYFDLQASYLSIQHKEQTRFTPPVQSILALNIALDELEQETVHGRLTRYHTSWILLCNGMKKLNFKLYTPEHAASWIVTAFYDHPHPKYKFDDMYYFLKSKGYVIYPGKVEANTFRIANIGNIDYRDINELLKIIKEYITCLN
jgi:2-aminoethylphosphonate-pyruvate transaminase